MKKLLVIGLLFLLPSCGKQLQDLQDLKNNIKLGISATFTPDNLDSVTIAIGTAESAAYSYRDLCQRKVIDKSCWGVIKNLQPYENKAYISYITLKKFVRANPTADASTFIKAAKDAITSLKNEQFINGVK